LENIAVEVRNVVKRFGEVVAVDHVSLQIQDGEFFSMLGPSGCGKTTTLRMIAGFEQPTEGEIFIDGQPSAGISAYERNTNMVFQNYALFPHMTVADNVAFGLEMKRVPKAGRKRRVTPLGALDLKLRKEMQLELKELQHQVGITFVYVTHDQEEALTMSDRIAVMHDGRVLQVGSPTEIYERPNSRFVANFIGETNFIAGEVVESNNGHVAVKILPDVTIEALADARPSNSQITVAIRPEKLRLWHEPPTLHDNYLPGTIQEMVYIGTDTHFQIALAEDLIIRVRQQNSISTPDQQAYMGDRGDEVYVTWASDSVLLLEE
jgi:spermidine/putrescine transport system ATP-binding protein